MASINETTLPPGSQAESESESGDNTELIIALVALVASVAALIIATLQALQQYYSSAKGYSYCSSAVIGGWAVHTKRRIPWSEFRFEVQFMVPVIFVSPPENKKGPLGRHPKVETILIDGFTPYDKIYTPTKEDYEIADGKKQADEPLDHHDKLAFDAEDEQAVTKQLVHTAENEKATWLGLLMAIQRMEEESSRWQRGRTGAHKQATTPLAYPLPPRKTGPRAIPERSLIVCLQ
jgi:hypothetical protein